MRKFSVTVVVPAYNCEQSISKTIDAILQQSYKVSELIVVDDGSTDRSGEIISFFDSVTYIRQKNLGPAAARNRGAKEAKSEIVFFTDSDCIPRKEWIEKAMEHFVHPAIGAVCGSYGIANQESLLARCIQAEIEYRHHKLMPEFVKAFGSYNFGVRKKVFDKVGGFDEEYVRASGEDNDLSYKIIRDGHQIYFAKDSLVDHFHPTKFLKYLKEQFQHGFWRAKMYVSHPQMMKGDDYTFWKDIVEVPLSFIFLMFLFLSPFFVFARNVFFVLFFVLMGLECVFGILMGKSFLEKVSLGFVMFLRAFSRVCGFAFGAYRFILKSK